LVERHYAIDEEIQRSFRLLYAHAPRTVDAYMELRNINYSLPPEASLTAREKELIILGMECALRKSNPPPVFHAVSAVEAGATIEDIAEVISLAIMIGGMITYQESGRFILDEAEKLLQPNARTE
jgi:alkylhydroperoxidase/carboxymuconolactone decarboxylase family protein YurZ